ncbi:MarR family winged helix-turn-helix transcriptional regulator [Micromonospora sp. LOL_025]|uniref:MarR family winged helix-turn-helix transcriptional regulator n=1 Tax=Micromonospora sp. LOL_025 TaxID=3345413 RepID=UPI003A8AAF29
MAAARGTPTADGQRPSRRASRSASGRDLSRLLQLDPGTLSPLLKRLEAAGYVRRERDPADERSLAVTLTAAGRALRERAEQIPPAIVERLGMPVEDLRHLHAVLTRVIDAANCAGGSAAERGQASA